MARITVGYQDGCLAPLFVSMLSVTKAVEIGADTVWFPDHFMGFAPKWMWTPESCAAAAIIPSGDAIFDPVALMGYMAAKFPGVTIGTSVTEPIRRHPMSLAQSFVTLDHLTEGRVILGIGNGLRENTDPYGFDATRRVARLEEALEILQRLLSSRGAPVTYAGRFWHLDGAVFDLPLYNDRSPPIFVGAHAPRMLRLTGRFATGWLPGQVVTAAEYAARLHIIRTAAEEAGRSFEHFVAAQTMLLVLADSRDEAMEKALASNYAAYNALGLPGETWAAHGLAHPLGAEFIGTLDLVPSRIGPEAVAAAKQRMTPELLAQQYYFGTPRDIADAVAPLATVGCRHFIFANLGATFTGRGMKDFEAMAALAALLKEL